MPQNPPLPEPVTFKKNLPFISDAGSTGFKILPPKDPAVLRALAANEPLPDRPIRFADVSLTTSSDKPIVFAKSGTGSISFSNKFGAFSSFGVYPSGTELLKELPADEFVLPGLDFGLGDEDMLSAIRWGVAAEIKASGSMALGAMGTATLTASASGQGLFAVVRRLPKLTGARDVIQDTADSWRVPRQVHTPADLDPGTWLLADLLGSIDVKLGAQMGMTFNWLREIGVGELAGDIGLRLQLGISTAIGIRAGGKLALVVSRETDDPKLRLRLIRLTSREFNFAMQASATVDQGLPDIPPNADDFIQAVFGVHGQQIVSSLAAVERWTDPKKKLSEVLAQGGIDGAENLIAFAAGVEVADLQKSFDAVHGRLSALIGRWKKLPHTVTTNLLKALDSKTDIEAVREVAAQLVSCDSKGLKSLLESRLGGVAFLETATGKYLESVAAGPLLGLLSKRLDDVRRIAKETLGVLDGSTMEETLTKLHSYIGSKLKVTSALDVANKTDFKSLDGLLRRKLAAFLGKTSIDAAEFDRLRTSIGEFLNRRRVFYEKALQALRKKYNFEVVRTFQKTETDQALLDVVFDYGSDPAGVQRHFDASIGGDFNFLFVNPHPGISIGLGELTHGLTRQTHTEVTLPFFRGEMDHVNRSVATAKIEESDGRVLIYTAEASDRSANDERISVMSLAMGLAASGIATPNLRVHQNKLELNYTLLWVRRELHKKDLLGRLRPLAKAYFPRSIPSPSGYCDFLDAKTEETIINGPKALGNALLSLQVTMPENAAEIAGNAWLALPANAKDQRYAAMAAAIRSRLRNLIAGSYFTEAERFRDRFSAKILLAYASLDPSISLDFMDKAKVSAELRKKATAERLSALLRGFQDLLSDADWKKEYRPSDAGAILAAVPADDKRLTGMLFAETRIVEGATKAGVAIGKFVKKSGEKPADAVKALAEFGANLTDAFHGSIVSMYVGDAIQAVGTEVFIAATRAILPRPDASTLPEEGAAAMLSIQFMKPELPFDEKVLLARGRMTEAEIAMAEHLIEA